MEREIRVVTPDGEMRTFVVHPDRNETFPIAVLFMDGVGYREQVKDNARRFAEGGYHVVAPDLYYRAGELAFDPAELMSENADPLMRDKMMQAARSVSPDGAVDDTKAALRVVAGDDATGHPLVCVGYCMGARIALRFASAMPGEVVAAAGIHPGSLVNETAESPHHDLRTVRGELYFAFAEIDRTATPESVEKFAGAMESLGVKGKVERISNATHGFAMADLPVYDAAAAERHFAMVLDLWDRNARIPATR